MKRWLVLAFLIGAGCTDSAGTRRALHNNGFTAVQVGGYAFFGCGKDDSFATHFTAVNPTGQTVSGVVCCGWWKNCTVRF